VDCETSCGEAERNMILYVMFRCLMAQIVQFGDSEREAATVGTYCTKERGKRQKDREYASSGTGTTWCDLSTEKKKRKNMKR
jgi:hypothetical protein